MDRSLFLLSAGAALLLAPTLLLGQARPDAGTVATVSASDAGVASEAGASNSVADVQAHVLRALDFYRQKQYAAAIKEFEEANAISPSADFVFNIARANELLADEIAARTSADPRATAQELIRYRTAAIEHFEKYLRDKVNPPDAATVRTKIDEIRHLIERSQETLRRNERETGVRFNVQPSGATVFLDDRQVGVSPMGEMVTAEPGVHRVRITARDLLEWNAQIRVRPGELSIANASLAPATMFRTQPGQHLASYIIGGVGIASLVAGAGVGIFAVTRPPDPFDCQSMGGCTRHDTAVAADVILGIGTVLVIGAVVTYFVESSGSRTQRVTPSTHPVDDPPSSIDAGAPTTTLDAGARSGTVDGGTMSTRDVSVRGG